MAVLSAAPWPAQTLSSEEPTDTALMYHTPCRSAFQRAVVVPSAALEALWSAYERFELEGAAEALGRRALDDMRPRHNAAKAAYRLRRKHLEGLDPEQLALPPGENHKLQCNVQLLSGTPQRPKAAYRMPASTWMC